MPSFGGVLFTDTRLTNRLRGASGVCQSRRGKVRPVISRRKWLSAFTGLALLAASGAYASPKSDEKALKKAEKKKAHQEAIEALQRGEILPLVRILEISKTHVAGDILEVEFKGGPIYEIKVLTATGSVRKLKLDARTGALLTIKDD